jgi:alkylation response protein AidB-like acyl-CoA dehydrogenase
MTELGFFRLLTPHRFGGHDVSFRTAMEVVEALGRASGSAAWVVSISADGALIASRGSEQLQSEVFRSPDLRIAGSLKPAKARRTDGGLLVSGSWPYLSGAPHANWLSLPAAVPEGQAYICLVPASQLHLHDTWRTVGMRGTGSHTFTGENFFVPEYRTIALSTVANGQPGDHDAAQRLPLLTAATLLLTAPLLGLGHAAADYVIETTQWKSMHHTPFDRQSDSVGVQVQIAEAKLKLRTARLHLFEVADALDAREIGNDEAGYTLRAEAYAQTVYAVQQVLGTIQVLMNVHGAGGFAESSPLQQYWRDANTAARHSALNSFVGYEVFGKSLLAVPDRICDLV